MLNKEDMMFNRDGEGKLIPEERELDLPDKPKVEVVPMTRGESLKFMRDVRVDVEKDWDFEIVKKYCITPKIEDKDIDMIKPYYIKAIAKLVMKVSGLLPEEEFKDVVDIDEIKKKLTQEVKGL